MKLPKPTWRRSLSVIAISLLIVAISFVLWANSTNPIMPEAETALLDTDAVDVTIAQYIEFVPKNVEPTVGYIFYPGGRVKAEAYAPSAMAIAEQGYYVAIVYAPLNLAFFNVGAGSAVIADHPNIKHWAVGGHSLGGVASSLFAEQNPTLVEGLVILASYPANNALRNRDDLAVTLIYATNDGVPPEEILKHRVDLPLDTVFVEIEGGNHGQFGWYGLQPGDNPATITHAEQTAQVVSLTVQLLEKINQ